MADALAHITAAINALTNEVTVINDTSFGRTETIAPAIETTIAMDMERMAGAMGCKPGSLLYALAESIREAVIELHAARDLLGGMG